MLATRKRTLGNKHPETIRIANSLAGTLSVLGKHAEAEMLQL